MFAVFITALILLSTSILVANFAVGANDKLEIITSGVYGKGYRYNVQGWVYLHIEGEPYERGYQYGYLASDEIVDMISRWSNWGHRENIMKFFIFKNRPEKYDELSEQWWNIVRGRAERFFWRQFPEEYQKEMEGIADGVHDGGGTVHGRTVDYIDILSLNVVEETRQTIQKFGGRGRPFKMLFNMIKGSINNFQKEEHFGHCNGFIATGDATIDRRIVMAHSTIFPPNYIPQRANIILDVKPSKGHRFVMTCFPGYIWSSEDYYQNECGILLMETTLWPSQGPWKLIGTTPVGARVRRAIQYSNSIDDVIQSLLDGNNGLYANDWIMGDTKTGEIASLELALYNHVVTRTKNGFLWSCCNTKNDKVRWELFSIFGLGIPGRIFFRKFIPNPRDIKFEELGNQFYGKIDITVVKKIMSTPPISDSPIDCKITDSKLVEDLGLWAYMGNPDGSYFKPKPEEQEELKGLTDVPGAGWVKLYACKSKPTSIEPKNGIINTIDNDDVLWRFETGDTRNIDYASCTLSDGILNVATSTGKIYSLDSKNGRLLWKDNINKKSFTPAASDDLVFIGTAEGLYAFDKESGIIKWEQLIDGITSKPVVSGDILIASCSNGDIYLFDKDSGEQLGSHKFPDGVVVSDATGDTIYIGSGDTCYAFNFLDKKIKWQYKTEGIITASPGLGDNMVYVSSWDGRVHALDSSEGDIKWTFETGWGVDTTPTQSDEMVYFGSTDNNFYCLDAENGSLIWCFNCKAAIHSSPVVYGEYVFFGCDDGRLYALNKETGDLEWSFTPGYFIKDGDVNNFITTPILSQPVVKDGVVYISAEGNVYALDAQTIEDFSEETLKETTDFDNTLLFSLIIVLIISVFCLYFRRKKRSKR